MYSICSKVLKELPVGDLQPDETIDAMHEANLLRNLDHPGIVKFYDSFVDGEFFCIVTEFAEVVRENDPANLIYILSSAYFLCAY